MSGLCYWCESRGLMQCKNCTRSFCKFCIKNGHSNDESKCVCFICGCYELTEVDNESSNGCLRDREMRDMLHRYEELCSNDKLANSIHDLLINIDALSNEKLPRLFDVIKMNICSMLHDVQKVESMVNHAMSEKRTEDVDKILIPLLKVVIKHHVFKKLGRSQHCFSNEKSMNFTNCETLETDGGDFIDLTEQSRMDLSTNNLEDSDYERMQRSPQCLAEEEKSTTKFEISDTKEDDNYLFIMQDSLVLESPKKRFSSNSLSLISSQMDQPKKAELQLSIKNSPKTIESVEEIFHTPSKENQLEKRKRSKRQSDNERRSVRLRSESSVIVPSFNALHSDLSQAMTVFKSAELLSPTVQHRNNLKKSVEKRSSPKKLDELIVEIKDEMNYESLFEVNNCSSSSSLEGNKLDSLKKFTQIVNRNKNSHLVSPAPIAYEKPFVLKDAEKFESLDDLIKQPVSNKTWSWERHPPSGPKYLIPTKKKSLVNGDISKTVIIQKLIPDSTIVAPIRERSRLSAIEPAPIKRSLSPLPLQDSDEPKKKRGRPRKYFDYTAHRSDMSNASHEERCNSSDLSDSKG